ncbi:TIGR04086 family membrane protein, partial [Dysosmobacter welbionis]
LKFVLGPAVADLDFILRPAVIPVKLALHHRGAAGRLRQGDLLGPLCGDIVTAGRVAAVPGGAAGAVVPDLEIPQLPIGAEDGAGDGVDVVVIFGGAAVKLHLILHPAVIPVQVGPQEHGVGLFDTGVIQGDLLGPVGTDIV